VEIVYINDVNCLSEMLIAIQRSPCTRTPLARPVTWARLFQVALCRQLAAISTPASGAGEGERWAAPIALYPA